MFIGFSSLQEAADFVLDLAETTAHTTWEQFGLPAIQLRMALHLGPVIECNDPVLGLASFFGTQLSRAARMESVTPPGEVYCSQEFAALAELLDVKSIHCEYAGRVPLAKSYGTFPLYHLRRS